MRPPMLAHSWVILFSFQAITGEEENKCVPLCPDGWEKLEDRCYLWPTTLMTWAEAEHFCKEGDGFLASVTNLNIHEYIMSKVVKNNNHSWFWVGGTDQEQEGNWKWTDGSDWNFTNSQIIIRGGRTVCRSSTEAQEMAGMMSIVQ